MYSIGATKGKILDGAVATAKPRRIVEVGSSSAIRRCAWRRSSRPTARWRRGNANSRGRRGRRGARRLSDRVRFFVGLASDEIPDVAKSSSDGRTSSSSTIARSTRPTCRTHGGGGPRGEGRPWSSPTSSCSRRAGLSGQGRGAGLRHVLNRRLRGRRLGARGSRGRRRDERWAVVHVCRLLPSARH